MIDLSPTAQGWLHIWREANARIAVAEEVKAKARTEIERELGDDEEGRIDGAPVVRWAYVSQSRVDTKRLKDMYPLVWDASLRTVLSRRFTVVDE